MDIEDIDRQLKQLALEAQKTLPRTSQRQRSLTSLVRLLCQSQQLVRPYSGQFKGFYNDIYAEAQQRLLLYLCENIDRYDPEREVLQWANFLMQKRFFVESSRDVMPTLPKGLDRTTVNRMTLDALDKKAPVDQQANRQPSVSEEVMQCIREDCDGIFRNTHIVHKPQAHFQFIALQFLEGYSWKELSTELDVKVVTLSSFYQRCLLKFAPIFKAYLTL